jgi:GTP-binding protein HflX
MPARDSLETAFLVAAEVLASSSAAGPGGQREVRIAGRGQGRAPGPRATRPSSQAPWSTADSLEELAQLADTAGLRVAGSQAQRLHAPNPFTYVGKGKLQEIGEEARAAGVGTLLFDDELTPAQARNIERELGDGLKVVDRTGLILDIFAQHARTREGQIQVEMAQYAYLLPRLSGMWTHLIRQAGGRAAGGYGVGLRGPGETQLETDRRRIRARMDTLRRQLEEVRRSRAVHYRHRRRREQFTAVLVGYTNAGKSSLLNALCRSQGVESEDGGPPLAYAADQLFATLDPTTRRIRLPSGSPALFTDTVGFIRKLPAQLVAAFRATLEGIEEADLLVHVADAAHPRAWAQVETVRQILSELGVSDRPSLLVWNKSDAVPASLAPGLTPGPEGSGPFVGGLAVSALTGEGLPRLLAAVEEALRGRLVRVQVELPYPQSALTSRVFEQGSVDWYEHGERGTRLSALVPPALAAALAPFRRAD